VVYGCLSTERRQELRAICNAVNTDQRMQKIYSVMAFLGFDTWKGICAHDQATLTLMEKYVKFKQGEVWMEIEKKFSTGGFRPTGPDRARLQSGIAFSEHLATIVMKEQTRLLIGEQEELGKQENERLAAKIAQAKLEYDIKFYKRDKSQVTAKEKAAARAHRDAMLAASREDASRQLAEATMQLEVT
jgi:cilia- and flagella-associated protein 69